MPGEGIHSFYNYLLNMNYKPSIVQEAANKAGKKKNPCLHGAGILVWEEADHKLANEVYSVSDGPKCCG